MLPMIMKQDCVNWCADQFFHANNQSYWFVVVILASLFIYTVVMNGWERMCIKEEVAEKICGFCVMIALVMSAVFLLYTFFLFEPKYTADFVKNVTVLSSNISTGLIGG